MFCVGLCIRTKLERSLPDATVKLDIFVKQGTHSTVDEINKQINDKVLLFLLIPLGTGFFKENHFLQFQIDFEMKTRVLSFRIELQ